MSARADIGVDCRLRQQCGVTQAAQAFGLDVDNDVNWRIAIVSDGCPHYVHLITEHMSWQAFGDETECETLGAHHCQLGLREAIEEINVEIKGPYEKAVLHRLAEWEGLVWTTADCEELFRENNAIQQSYHMITMRRENPIVIDNGRFADSLRKLRTESFGAVLESVPQRSVWYRYREKMRCGFVRMQARASGIEPNCEVPLPSRRMHVCQRICAALLTNHTCRLLSGCAKTARRTRPSAACRFLNAHPIMCFALIVCLTVFRQYMCAWREPPGRVVSSRLCSGILLG